MDSQDTLDSILRLLRLEDRATSEERHELRTVRERLEASIGPTVRPAEAARFLGVSRPTLKHWLDRGEIASVLTPSRRREVPVSELISLGAEVKDARRSGRERALAAVINARKERASTAIDLDRVLPRRKGRTHQAPELQSLAYHRLVAERLTPQLVEEANARLAQWTRSGRIDPRWASEWREVLEQPVSRIARSISSASPRARELRQTSPFAGVLNEQERRRLVEAVEARQ